MDKTKLTFTVIRDDQAKVDFPSEYSKRQVTTALRKLINSCGLKDQLAVRTAGDNVFLNMIIGDDLSMYLKQIQNKIDECFGINTAKQRNSSRVNEATSTLDSRNLYTKPVEFTYRELNKIVLRQEPGIGREVIIEWLQVLFNFGLVKEDILVLNRENNATGWLKSTATCIRTIMSGRYHFPYNYEEIIHLLRQGKTGREQLWANCNPIDEYHIRHDGGGNFTPDEDPVTLPDYLLEDIQEFLRDIETQLLSVQEPCPRLPQQSVQSPTPSVAASLQTQAPLLPQKRPYIAIAPKFPQTDNKRLKSNTTYNTEEVLTEKDLPTGPGISSSNGFFQPPLNTLPLLGNRSDLTIPRPNNPPQYSSSRPAFFSKNLTSDTLALQELDPPIDTVYLKSI